MPGRGFGRCDGHHEMVDSVSGKKGLGPGHWLMKQRTLAAGFIAPCLPTKIDKLPSSREWLPRHRPQGRQPRAPLQPPRQRRDLALIRRGWLEYPLTDRRQFDILRCGPRSSWGFACNSVKTGGTSSRCSAARRHGGRGAGAR